MSEFSEAEIVRTTRYTADYDGTPRPDSEIEEIVWLTHVDHHRVSPVGQIIFDRLRETAHQR